MRRQEGWGAALLLPWASTVAGQSQVVITIAVPYCPTYSSSLASLSSILPGYSSSAFSYGSMSVPTSITSSMSSSRSPSTYVPESSNSASPSLSSSSVSAPSPSYYIDAYGQVYQLSTDTGISGNTIEPQSAGSKRRQMGSTLESCFEDCSTTTQCQAISYLGSTCLLYSSVRGTTFLLGGIAGFNAEKFTGFTNDTGNGPTSWASSLPPLSSLPSARTSSLASRTSSSSLYISYYSTTTTGGFPGATSSGTVPNGSPLPGTNTATPGMSSSSSAAMSSSIVSSGPPGYASSSSSARASVSSLQQPSTPSDLLSSTPISSNSGDLPSSYAGSSSLAGSFSTTTFGDASSASATTQGAGSSSATTSSPISESQWSSEGIGISASLSIPPWSTVGGTTPVSSLLSSADGIPTTASDMPPATTSLAVVSTTSSLLATPTTAAGYTCHSNDASTITDINSIQYELRCSSDTNGVGLGQGPAATSFNDCFVLCDAATSCTGFTYLGAANGAGSGECYLKQGDMYFTEGDSFRVAAIRMTPLATTSAAETSSMDTQTTISVPEASVTPSTAGPTMLSSYLSSLYDSSESPTAMSSSSIITSSSVSSGAVSSSSSAASSALSSSATSPTSSSSSRSSLSTVEFIQSSSSSSSARASSSSSAQAAPSATPVVNNGKRGLAYTNASYTLSYSLSGQNSRVSWGYDWYYSRYTDSVNTTNPAIKFIPLLFSDAADLMAAWPEKAQAAIDDGADALMSFNEPDLCYPGSACMTVQQSVTAYRQAMLPFAGKIRLGAPAVTDGGAPTGLTYLRDFMGNCSDCTVDFINIHWYNNVYAFSYLQYYVQQAYKMFRLPIWITEFGIDGSGGTDAQYQAFLQQALPWLDAVPYVERYAWFLDAPGYLINANGSGLSAQGMIYNSYTAACANWNNTAGLC